MLEGPPTEVAGRYDRARSRMKGIALSIEKETAIHNGRSDVRHTRRRLRHAGSASKFGWLGPRAEGEKGTGSQFAHRRPKLCVVPEEGNALGKGNAPSALHR
jgi:hypothetical protein